METKKPFIWSNEMEDIFNDSDASHLICPVGIQIRGKIFWNLRFRVWSAAGKSPVMPPRGFLSRFLRIVAGPTMPSSRFSERFALIDAIVVRKASSRILPPAGTVLPPEASPPPSRSLKKRQKRPPPILIGLIWVNLLEHLRYFDRFDWIPIRGNQFEFTKTCSLMRWIRISIRFNSTESLSIGNDRFTEI